MRKFIYLISPNKISKNFYKDLDQVLATKKVKYFQLRLKSHPKSKIIKIGKKIRKITRKYKVNFIINDFPDLVNKIKADGCHLGQSDSSIKNSKKFLKTNKIIGVTCHGSKKLISAALEDKPDYLAIGSFFKSKLKPNAKRAKRNLIVWCKRKSKIPIVGIGGINNKNYKSLIKFGLNYLAISSFIWNNPRLKPKEVIKLFN
mgnify:FL=1